MARPRSNSPQRKGRGTSFGKKSDAEKSFRKRKISSRSGRSDARPGSSPYGSSSREDKPKSFGAKPSGYRRSGEGSGRDDSRGKAPFKSSPGNSLGAGKPEFRKTGGKSFGSRPDREDSRDKKPFGKRDGSSFNAGTGGPPKFNKPYRSDGDKEKRPFRKTDSSFGARPDRGEFKKPFRKTDGFSKFSRPERGEAGAGSDREKRPPRKSDSSSFGPAADRSEFKKPFRKTDGFSKSPRPESGETSAGPDREKRPPRKSDSSSFGPAADRSEFKKPFRKTEGFSKPPRTESIDGSPDQDEKRSYEKKDRKSFVQSRVVTSADFIKPGRKEEPVKDDGLTRLNKYIANSGVGSRREADELIKMGLISVNGTTITALGTKVKPGDVVRYEDRVLKAEKLVYILLNKPKGFITTTEDPQERNTVMGLVAAACKERIYPVGRLDRNTTGLLLLTNDGDLADKLTHPSYKAKKVYKVELDRPLTKNDFKKIVEGVHLEEGRAMVDDVAIISEDDKTVGLEIHIGWNRVVRRIFETLGYDVLKLDRSVFAGMDKKDLSRGQWRFLKPEEVVRLKHFK